MKRKWCVACALLAAVTLFCTPAFAADRQMESNGGDLKADLTLSGPVAAINFTW